MADTVRAEFETARSAPAPNTETARPAPASHTSTETARRLRARQHDEFGGVNWGSAFFGWLVTVGMATILIGLLSAAGAALGFVDGDGTPTGGGARGGPLGPGRR